MSDLCSAHARSRFSASVPCDDQLCYNRATCFTLVGMVAFITGNAIFH